MFHKNDSIFVHRLAARPLMANTHMLVFIGFRIMELLRGAGGSLTWTFSNFQLGNLQFGNFKLNIFNWTIFNFEIFDLEALHLESSI